MRHLSQKRICFAFFGVLATIASTATMGDGLRAQETDAVATGTQEDVATVARPKVKHDGHFAVTRDDGSRLVGYDIYYYFQAGKSFQHVDAHVFFAPPFHLEVDDAQQIRHNIHDDGSLTLYVVRPVDSSKIKNDLRDELLNTARKRDIAIASGKKYRVNVLGLKDASFEFDKKYLDTRSRKWKRIISQEMEGVFTQSGEIAVHFTDLHGQAAENILGDLQSNKIQLRFRYTFAGITEESCSAKSEDRGVQDVDLFRKVAGDGREGFVARHQVANIADSLIRENIFTVRCASGAALPDLLEILTNQLNASERRTVADWALLDELIEFDPESFKADITEKLNSVKNEVVREQALDAMSKAMGEAESEATEAGLALGYSLFMVKAEGSYAESEAKDMAEARKEFTDSLGKMGLSVEWEGQKFVPKSVDVHSVAELRAKWGQNLEVNFTIPAGGEGQDVLQLTKDDRTVTMPHRERRQIDRRLQNLEEKLASVLLNVERAATDAERSAADTRRAVAAATDAMEATERVEEIAQRASSDAWLATELGEQALDLAETARNKVRSAIRVASCNYEFHNPYEGRVENYYFNLGNSSDMAIFSDWDLTCHSYGGHPHFELSRYRGNWHLLVSNLNTYDACDTFDVRVIYINGERVERDRTQISSLPSSPPLQLRDSWCSN